MTASTSRVHSEYSLCTAVIGCTEIPLGLPADAVDVPLIDPAALLARTLVRRARAA
ncbi:hypothetical protein ACFZCY_12175 [Streptomyces sp. NPDC007983]|uniref:hypothetical protein n=1 Tax=Streptomyces sp. NPDC007983 TaxID=3364800 RepID=UPI0036E1980B